MSIVETRNQELEAMNKSLAQRIEAMNQDFRSIQEQEQANHHAISICEEHATMLEELKEMLQRAGDEAEQAKQAQRGLSEEVEQLKEEALSAKREKESREREVGRLREELHEKTRFIERYKRELLEIKELMVKMEPSSQDQSTQIQKLKGIVE